MYNSLAKIHHLQNIILLIWNQVSKYIHENFAVFFWFRHYERFN